MENHVESKLNSQKKESPKEGAHQKRRNTPKYGVHE